MKRLMDILGSEIMTREDITGLAKKVLAKQRDAKQVAIGYIIEEWNRLVQADQKVETWYSIIHNICCANCGGVILRVVGPFSKPTCGGNPILGCPKCSTIKTCLLSSRDDIMEVKKIR